MFMIKEFNLEGECYRLTLISKYLILYFNLQLMHHIYNYSSNHLGYSGTHHLFEIDSLF